MKIFDYRKIKSIKGNCGNIKESITEDIGFSRANMRKGLSIAHYHKKLTEHYLVIEGHGVMRIKTKCRSKSFSMERNSDITAGALTSEKLKIKEIKLRPGILVKIEPGEIHQVKTSKKLIVEVITRPVWVESDEIVKDEELF
jgi:mannose-6-phosphate isomerase-like protein (cupin superfamily)